MELPQQDVVAGGGGPISNEELWSALQLPTYAEEQGPVKLRVLPRTLVHTDSARAYFNLGWREAELPPRHVDQAANGAETPAQQAARWAAEEAAGLRAPIDEDALPLVILAERLRAPPRPPEAHSLPEWRARPPSSWHAQLRVTRLRRAAGSASLLHVGESLCPMAKSSGLKGARKASTATGPF